MYFIMQALLESATLICLLLRLLLTRESSECFQLILKVTRQVCKAAEENIDYEREIQKGI